MKHGARWFGRVGMGGAAAVTAAVLGLGACSNPIARITTDRAVSNSFGALLDQSGINLQISLGATPQQLQQIGASTGKGNSLSPKMADTIAATSIVFNFATGHGESLKSATVRTDHANQFDFALQIGSAAPVEIRYVDQTIYARADASTLLTDFGQSGAKAASFQHSLQSANAYVPGLAALGQGQWVSAKTSDFGSLFKGVQSKLPTSNSTASNQLIAQLKAAFKSNSTFANSGTQNGRTEYLVTVQAHNFVQQVMSALPSSLSSLPGASGATKGLNGLVNKIPANQTVVLRLWVKDNKAQEIDLDLNQFKHKLSFAVPLRIVIGSATPVAKPSGATALDLSKVASLFGGLLGGSSSGSGSVTLPVG